MRDSISGKMEGAEARGVRRAWDELGVRALRRPRPGDLEGEDVLGLVKRDMVHRPDS